MRVTWIVVFSVVVTAAAMRVVYGSVDLVGPGIAVACSFLGATFTLGRVARLQILMERQRSALQLANDDLSRFARTVAHDLKGPLAGVIGWSDVASDMAPPDHADLRAALDDIRQSAIDAAEVVDGLLALALARSDEIEILPVQPLEALTRAEKRIRSLLTHHSAHVDVVDSAPFVLAHPVALEAVWANLLSNAVKYGGRPAEVRVTSSVRRGAVRFDVADNGGGVAAGFDPFGEFEADPNHAWSHGLGLPIARHLVERFGGSIGHEPNPSGGTIFWFELPLAQQVTS